MKNNNFFLNLFKIFVIKENYKIKNKNLNHEQAFMGHFYVLFDAMIGKL